MRRMRQLRSQWLPFVHPDQESNDSDDAYNDGFSQVRNDDWDGTNYNDSAEPYVSSLSTELTHTDRESRRRYMFNLGRSVVNRTVERLSHSSSGNRVRRMRDRVLRGAGRLGQALRANPEFTATVDKVVQQGRLIDTDVGRHVAKWVDRFLSRNTYYDTNAPMTGLGRRIRPLRSYSRLSDSQHDSSSDYEMSDAANASLLLRIQRFLSRCFLTVRLRLLVFYSWLLAFFRSIRSLFAAEYS